MKHICFIIHLYSNPVKPYSMNFVQNLAWAVRDMGYKVTIISPLPVNIIKAYIKVPYHLVEKTKKGNAIDVFYPKTIEFGQTKTFFGKSLCVVTTFFMEKAAERVLRKLTEKPDVLYGHFLAPSGVVVARLGKKYNIPAFFACGESHDTIGQYGAKRAQKDCSQLSGIVSVSTALKKYVLDNNVTTADKIEVFPNGFDIEKFKPIDKNEARKHFGLPQNDILIAFLGAFNTRKGIDRLCDAMKKIDGAKLICAGHGDIVPNGTNVIFSKRVPGNEVPYFLYSADIFVLPTLAEGCSNAIVEAIGCGLPIISSNLPFNDDILDDSYSIRVDPMSVDEISSAISKLVYNDRLRKDMSEAALKKRSELSLTSRAVNIVNFINSKLQ